MMSGSNSDGHDCHSAPPPEGQAKADPFDSVLKIKYLAIAKPDLP